ncbi:MAG: hypothetical protein NWF08_07585 [Candidatus Bathyarchaeota archaeon]|nr:hypothetical protein [Candidatus Bathyarchaeota archaeon]
MKSGFSAGIIAGFGGGVVAFIFIIIGDFIGIWVPFEGALNDVVFLTNQAVTHIGLNTIWGAFFGLIYSRFYTLIPGKGIWKGVYFGLFLFFLINLIQSSYLAAFGSFFWVISNFYIAFPVRIIYGLVLGALYEK